MNSAVIGNFSDFYGAETLFVALGSVGVVVVGIPTLFLGLIILFALIRDKKRSQIVNSVFIAITVTSIIAVFPSILFDVSLITDLPTFGKCTQVEYIMQYSVVGLLVVLILIFTLLLTIVFYVSIRPSGPQCCSVIFVRLVIIVLVCSAVGQTVVIAGAYSSQPMKLVTVRGSFCAVLSKSTDEEIDIFTEINFFVTVMFFVIPFTLSIFFVVLTCWRVVRTVVEVDKKVTRAMLIFLVSMILTNCLTRIPPFVLHLIVLKLDDDQIALLSILIGVLILQIQVPVLLFLILILNKEVRGTFCKFVLKILSSKCSKNITYSSDPITPVTIRNNNVESVDSLNVTTLDD